MMKRILFFLFISVSAHGQAEKQRNGLLSNTRFGKGMGVFVNAGSEQFEIDGYMDADMDFGLFGDLWFSHVDFDQNTNIELNTSLGYALQIKPNTAVGLGYSKFSYLGDEVSFLHDEGELFFGTVIGPVTGVVFIDSESNNLNYLGKIDMNHGPLKNVPADIFLQGYFEEENYDINISIIKNIHNHFTVGYMLSREKYDYEQPHKFMKNGQAYMKNTIEKEEGFFHTIYAGYIF